MDHECAVQAIVADVYLSISTILVGPYLQHLPNSLAQFAKVFDSQLHVFVRSPLAYRTIAHRYKP